MLQTISLNQLVVMLSALLFAVTLHEVAHGYAAYRLGDDTAMRAGRLTLNPLKHLDFIGSFLLPAVLVFSNAPFVLGYAKPVPINPLKLRPTKKARLYVAAAGVLTNIACALLAGWLFRIVLTATGGLPSHFILRPFFVDLFLFLGYSVIIHSVLAVFNLIPIPPLDGSRILAAFLPAPLQRRFMLLERFGFILIILLLATHVLGRIIYFFVPPLVRLSLGDSGLHFFVSFTGAL